MSVYEARVAQTIESGVEPLTLTFEEIRDFSSDKRILRTALQINSLDLGVLTPAQYRVVAHRSVQGELLLARQIKKLFASMSELRSAFPGTALFTVPAYAKVLKSGALYRLLSDALVCDPSIGADSVGVEFSADMLFDDTEQIIPRLQQLRELGVKLIVSDLGDEFCPVMRLVQMRFDRAFLDASAIDRVGDEAHDAMLSALITMLHAASTAVYACGLHDSAQLPQLEALGCDGYSLAATLTDSSEEVSDQ